jgi:hypothetical protein
MTKKRVNIKLLKRMGDYPEGFITPAFESDAQKLIDEGYAEMVLEPKTHITPEEARYWSDKATLDRPETIKYLAKCATVCNGKFPRHLNENDILFFNVLPQNYERWLKEYEEKIFFIISLFKVIYVWLLKVFV